MFLQHFSCNPEAFKGLGNAAVNSDNVADGANLLFGHAVGNRPPAMNFPFVHVAQCADHGEVHHGAGFGVYAVIAPSESPAPFGHHFLEWPGKFICLRQVLLDIFGAQGCFTLVQAQFESFFVHDTLVVVG